MRVPTLPALCQAVPDLNYLEEDGFEMVTETMFQLKALIGLGLIIIIGGTAIAIHKLQQLIEAIRDLHQDIAVIRLDNSRTMAELRRKQRY